MLWPNVKAAAGHAFIHSRQRTHGLAPYKDPNTTACVRCLECIKACPAAALTFGQTTREKAVVTRP
ncbi:MAG TPA: 4Fe-4S binding protein, partial [Firmicutes bacterium]|nr:4Fe-4S binding protein [Bacillota bacterium]